MLKYSSKTNDVQRWWNAQMNARYQPKHIMIKILYYNSNNTWRMIKMDRKTHQEHPRILGDNSGSVLGSLSWRKDLGSIYGSNRGKMVNLACIWVKMGAMPHHCVCNASAFLSRMQCHAVSDIFAWISKNDHNLSYIPQNDMIKYDLER